MSPLFRMDKSWILEPRTTLEYKKGLQIFLDSAFSNVSSDNRIKCPCSSCGFRLYQTRVEVFDNLLFSPFPTAYTVWLLHGKKDVGETSATRHESQHIDARDNPMQDMVNDVFNFYGQPANQEHVTSHGPVTEGENDMLPLPDGPNDKAKEFYELMRDGEQELYQGCVKYSKLSFLLRLYHIKCMCGMSDKAMTMIIELLHDAFENAKIPKSFYEAKKTIKKLGLSYKKIHACPNDCMLYRGEDKERQECKRCGTSRWKVNAKKNFSSDLEANKKKTLQPAKVLRYFPLIPRLQRLFMSSKTSTDMRWHSVDCHKDGLLRHPRDAEAWKNFDFTFPEFSQDPRNVRLALASDGFNPFGHMSANHSIWPVVLIPYNTPPWELWDGVQTFDALSTETFKMRAALMWTISDFPGYGILSGWSTYDGYSSNISRCVDVKQRRLFGLKSHDCHILMQQLLPIALRNALHGLVSAVLADLSSFFRQLCSKVLNPMDLDNLQNQIILTLCHLEMIFPPSFFTVMVHLVVHLVDEVRCGGPVHYRWMYPIERFLGHLKSFVHNMAQPMKFVVEERLIGFFMLQTGQDHLPHPNVETHCDANHAMFKLDLACDEFQF
ncbi:uncharacterized protein LOC132047619 [Lycium ferocissimum]|uniref:uncharacterized protein LOC132047619 n=1 Tax=Lycium ferocissimum TaxID=112874 RepID=UPI002815973C|nr:uncharacterized protein LOC132047619 [Lycium ferocissimum]